MITSLAILILSASNIALAVQLAFMARRHREVVTEVTELQGVVDSILIGHGMPAIFAERYDLEVVIDPSKIEPPSCP